MRTEPFDVIEYWYIPEFLTAAVRVLAKPLTAEESTAVLERMVKLGIVSNN
jgi:hypothetical protein